MYNLGDQFIVDTKSAVANEACILQGNKYVTKGVTIEIAKLIRVSFIK